MPTLCLAIISSQEEQVPMLMKYSLIGVCGSWNPFQVTFNLDISVWKSMSVLISPAGKTSKTCPLKGADRSTMYAHDVASVIKRARLNAYQIWMIHKINRQLLWNFSRLCEQIAYPRLMCMDHWTLFWSFWDMWNKTLHLLIWFNGFCKWYAYRLILSLTVTRSC